MNANFLKFKGANFLFFFLFEVGTIANTYAIAGENKILRIVLMVAGLLCFVKILKGKMTKRQVCVMASLLLISMIIYLKTSELSPFVTVVVIFSCKDINFDWIVNVTLYTKIILLGARFIMVLLGLVENEIVAFWRNGKTISRYTFGYPSPNAVHIQIAIVIILLLYKIHINDKCKNIFLFSIVHICLMLINYSFYCFTYSRTSFFVAELLILLSFLARSKFSIFLCQIAPYIMPFWLMLSVLGMIFYNRVSLFNILDSLLTGRFYYCNQMWRGYGLSLFGANIVSSNIIYDNSYARLLINLGLLYSVFILVSMYIITKISAKKKNVGLVLVLIGYQTLAFTESIYGYIFANMTLVLIGSLIYRQGKEIYDKEKYYHIYSNI